MKVQVIIMQFFIDNYQGGSGLPLKKKLLVNIPDDTKAVDIFELIKEKLSNKGIKGSMYDNEKSFPDESILSINILQEI